MVNISPSILALNLRPSATPPPASYFGVVSSAGITAAQGLSTVLRQPYASPEQRVSSASHSPAVLQIVSLFLRVFLLLLQNIKQPTPAPAPTPTPTPTPTGPIEPGSLKLSDIPVDANGNMSRAFVNELFKTSKDVNTRIFDNSEPSGLTKFARIGLRMLGHDLYDGEINGDVAFRTLLAPDDSHNRAIFQGSKDTPEQIAANKDMVRKWGQLDLQDDGKVNGSVYIKLVEDVWPLTDGSSISDFAKRVQTRDSSLNVAELLRATPNVETPQGLTEFARKSGVSAKQLLNFSLWGHRILDRSFTTQDLAKDALTNPRSMDFGLAQFSQETRDYMTSLSKDPNAESTVGLGVLNLLLNLTNNLPQA